MVPDGASDGATIVPDCARLYQMVLFLISVTESGCTCTFLALCWFMESREILLTALASLMGYLLAERKKTGGWRRKDHCVDGEEEVHVEEGDGGGEDCGGGEARGNVLRVWRKLTQSSHAAAAHRAPDPPLSPLVPVLPLHLYYTRACNV